MGWGKGTSIGHNFDRDADHYEGKGFRMKRLLTSITPPSPHDMNGPQSDTHSSLTDLTDRRVCPFIQHPTGDDPRVWTKDPPLSGDRSKEYMRGSTDQQRGNRWSGSG